MHGTQDEGEDWDAKYISLGGNTTKGGPKSLKFKKAKSLTIIFTIIHHLVKLKKQI